MSVMTDAKVAVELVIKSAKETHYSKNIGPSTRENDWWPEEQGWTTIDITFTNGYKKSYKSLSEIELIE